MEHSEKSGIQQCNLLRSIFDLYGRPEATVRIRKEARQDISEYDMPPDTTKGLVAALCSTLPCNIEGKSERWKLNSLLRKTGPLSATQDSVLARHVSRNLSFGKLKRDLNKWNSTVCRMRNEEQLFFPLNQDTLLPKRMENKSECKRKMRKPLLNGEIDVLNELPTVDIRSEHEKDHNWSIAKLTELRKDNAKFNAQYSYMLAKAARHKKIKSKKYHRMLKHKQIATLENISVHQNTNPIKVKQLLESSEKMRAKERATLRHQGKWAQRVKISAKQNPEWRKLLMQQLFHNYELTQKLSVTTSSEDETEKEEENRHSAVNNPWIAGPLILKEDSGGLSGKLEPASLSNIKGTPFHCSGEHLKISSEKILKKSKTSEAVLNKMSKNIQAIQDFNIVPMKINETLNVDAFIGTKPSQFQLKELCLQETNESNCVNDKKEFLNTVAEVFADDDIVTVLRKEGECISENSQINNSDSSVPGWGKWSGESSRLSAKKLKPSVITHNKVTLEKYANKNDVIFTENSTCKIKEQQVNEIPVSFIRVKDYEASIRFPIGKTWIPYIAHNNLVSPTVITKMGKVIKPIQEDF